MTNSNAGNPPGMTTMVRSIIELAEVYPKSPSQNDLYFDILWSEISKMANGQPSMRFTASFDKLREIAKAAFQQVCNKYSIAVDLNATAVPQTPSGASTPATDYSEPSRKKRFNLLFKVERMRERD